MPYRRPRRQQLPSEGIRFACRPGCTQCCAIPGVVYVGRWEAPAMAAFLGIENDAFMEKYMRPHFGDIFEFNFPDENPCMFLEKSGCAIYPARPLQCRTFPFWPDHLRDAAVWNGLKTVCPGIGEGHLHTWSEIEEIAAQVSFGPFLSE